MKCRFCSNILKEPEIQKTGICHDCWSKPFTITRICREDLREYFSVDEIAKFEDSDMVNHAASMKEAYLTDSFALSM